jgi:thiol-disulfide isomerase/thioredoxin
VRSSLWWTLAVVAVAVAIVAALINQLHGHPAATPKAADNGSSISADHRLADTAEALAEPRRRAGLPPCPTGSGQTEVSKLHGVVVQCAADGSEVDAARALAGRPVVLNLWAYWCGPCTDELPAMAEYQRQVGSAVTVVTVHQDPNETAGLLRLAELGVKLPTLQDGGRRITAALGVPNVMPATVVLRADGTVAKVVPRAFDNAADIAVVARDALR